MRIRLGDYNTMTVTRAVDFGLYLDGGDEGDILLPQRYVPAGTKVGDELEVFIYLDQEERPVATTERPLARVGDFAFLECSWVNEYGAFLSWGLMKDLFCPFREQKRRMEKGEKYIVYIYIDEESYRIAASAKVERYLSESVPPYVEGDKVQLLVQQKTDLGFKVIVDNQFRGLVYDNQVFRQLHTGDRLPGYVAAVRPDGKLDIRLQPTGRKQTEDFAEVLLLYLQEHGGVCDLGDKSEAEDIKRLFQVSKKTYKRAVGDLYKRRLITVAPLQVKLV